MIYKYIKFKNYYIFPDGQKGPTSPGPRVAECHCELTDAGPVAHPGDQDLLMTNDQ